MQATAKPWLKDELQTNAGKDDLHIAALRDDGVSDGTPPRIWSVVVDGSLYDQAHNGQRSRW